MPPLLVYMLPYLVDTHAHLHFPVYDVERAEVLARMRERRIWALTIGTALENSRRGIVLAESTPGLWATVGLHPGHVTSPHQDEQEGDVQECDVTQQALAETARSSLKVRAIGEAGLDFYRLDDHLDQKLAKEAQERVFRVHADTAWELDLPLVIHCRDALSRLAEILQGYQQAGKTIRAVVHSFTGTWEEAKPLLDLGCMLAVNGIATFPLRKTQDPATAIDRTIERIPLNRLLLETDSPYLAPVPYRGKRNEPSYVEEVAKHVGYVRGQSVEEIARHTTRNAIELFQLSLS